MEILTAILLGVLQGITEWLPISSSGHLVLVQQLFALNVPIIFDIMLHIGSLIVILFFFRTEILELITGLFNWEKDKLRIILMIIIASIPIAIVGYFFQSSIDAIFSNVRMVGFALLFTAVILFLSKYPKAKNGKLTYGKAFGIGLLQAVAILPGVSRSGSTISAGMMLGVKREDVARFSFLIFIPAILGALVLHIGELANVGDLMPVIVGMVVAVIVGYFSLRLLMGIIKNDKFYWFSVYCALLGVVVLVVSYTV